MNLKTFIGLVMIVGGFGLMAYSFFIPNVVQQPAPQVITVNGVQYIQEQTLPAANEEALFSVLIGGASVLGGCMVIQLMEVNKK